MTGSQSTPNLSSAQAADDGQPPSAATAALELIDVSRIHGRGDAAVHALRGLHLSVSPGELVAGAPPCALETFRRGGLVWGTFGVPPEDFSSPAVVAADGDGKALQRWRLPVSLVPGSR